MMAADLNERDTKLTQWLNEAHAKEAELEADLTTHIALTDKASYKKRLQQHLRETRDHKRRVASRIKKLGSQASGPSIPGMPRAAGELAGKTVAAVKGQVGAARAAMTEQAETHMRNAQEELREEHVEIAIYNRIETLANEVGDRETAQLAKSIRRDEERMAKFLDAELTRLVKAVVRADIPSDQRGTSGRSRRGSGSRRSAASSSSRSRRTASAASRSSSRSGSRSRSTGSGRSTGSSRRSSSASRSRSSSSSSRGSGSSRSGGSSSRSGSSRSGGSSSSSSRGSGSSRGGGSRGGGSRGGGSRGGGSSSGGSRSGSSRSSS
jgi:ferritin-like metal-binding protein YciE